MNARAADIGVCEPAKAPDAQPSARDHEILERLKQTMIKQAVSTGSYLNTTSREALDGADPSNTREAFTTLVCYYEVGLSEADWQELDRLQMTFGNLSNESVTTIITPRDIVLRMLYGLFGHDQAMKRFLIAHGHPQMARMLPILRGVVAEDAGPVLKSYQEYLEKYEVLRHP